MTLSPSADVVPSDRKAARRTTDPALAPRTRRLARQLIVLVAIPAALALALTGLWVTNAARSAGAYGQVGRLAALGQQVGGLAQAMADERSGAAAFVASGRPAAGLPALRREYAITDGQAAMVRGLVSQLGQGYPAQTRAGAAQVLASIARLPGLRTQVARGRASALAVITGYSAAISGLFPVSDGIADVSGNATLIASVRAAGALSRMIDHASQQQAILGVALTAGRFGPGALTALTAAQAQQASDLASFRNSATPEENWALTQTLARPLARQAQAVEQRAIAAGAGALALGPQASRQWAAGMTYTVGWMGHADRQLAGWIPADARALQRSEMRSALITGGAALGLLALVLLGALFAARSMMRRLRRLEAAAVEGAWAAAPPPTSPAAPSAGVLPAGFVWRSHSLLERLLRLIDSSELNEDDPERLASLFEMDHLATRIWRNSDSALVLADQEPPRPAEPLALVDVLRAAASEIEEYDRVILDAQPGVCVSGSAATDTVHLLAELLENATAFSPESAQVIVSGYAVVGGGSVITITDGGPGMPEEELTLLNWQLANPSPGEMAAAPRVGLLAVALLAARHGVTVTLSTPPDGGTTAEVYLPAALISLNAGPGAWGGSAWQGRAGEAWAEAGDEDDAVVVALPFSAPRFASGPEPSPGSEADEPAAVPAMLGAPLPSPAPGPSTGVIEPEPMSAEPGNGLPIFEAVRSGYALAFGRDLPRSGEQEAGQAPTGWPVRPPASWGDGGRAAAGPPAGERPASPWLPRVPPPGPVRGPAADQQARQASAAETAEATRSKLASFQRGSARARAVAETNRSAKQPGQDG